MCAVEVGLAPSVTTAVAIAGEVKKWPEKIGNYLQACIFWNTELPEQPLPNPKLHHTDVL